MFAAGAAAAQVTMQRGHASCTSQSRPKADVSGCCIPEAQVEYVALTEVVVEVIGEVFSMMRRRRLLASPGLH